MISAWYPEMNVCTQSSFGCAQYIRSTKLHSELSNGVSYAYVAHLEQKLCTFFFVADLDTNGKMTTFLVLPILQKLKREVFFIIRNSLRNHRQHKEFLDEFWRKKPQKVYFLIVSSMGKTRKVVILPLVSKSATKKTYTIPACIFSPMNSCNVNFMWIISFELFWIYACAKVGGPTVWIT